MTYLFQIMTSDAELQLATEIANDDLQEVLRRAKNQVRNVPELIGKKYLIAQYGKNIDGTFESTTLKADVITGI